MRRKMLNKSLDSPHSSAHTRDMTNATATNPFKSSVYGLSMHPATPSPSTPTRRGGDGVKTLITKLNSPHRGQTYTGIVAKIDSRGGILPDDAPVFWGYRIDTVPESHGAGYVPPVDVFRHHFHSFADARWAE